MNTVLDQFKEGKGQSAVSYENCSVKKKKRNTLTPFILVNSDKHFVTLSIFITHINV